VFAPRWTLEFSVAVLHELWRTEILKELFFADVFTVISTALAFGFIVFFSSIVINNKQIEHWGWFVFLMLLLGLAMSIMSGMKDHVGTPEAIFSAGSKVILMSSILGGLAFLVGILSLIIRKQDFWRIAFFAVSGIIIIKILLVETSRIIIHLRA
jgi:hypothetical protein